MGFFGGLLGRGLGKLGEMVVGKTRGIDGAELGDHLGSKILPFRKGGVIGPARPALRKGGKVKKPKSKAKKAKK